MYQQILLRLPADLARRASVAAANQGQSRVAWIASQLETILADEADPGVIIGYWQVFGGDVTTDDDCRACGQPMTTGVHVGVTAAGRVFGPLCRLCAGQE